MSNVFKGSEIVAIGIQIEKNGKDFYNALVGRSKEQKSKELFKFLAGEEEKHIAVFEKILSGLEEDDSVDSYPGEYASYMKNLASEHIFTQRDKGIQVAEGTNNDKEAIELGIKFEKDSITFYEGMKKVVKEHDHKIIEKIIEQEQAHLRQLSELNKEL